MGKKHKHAHYLSQNLARINFHERGFFKVFCVDLFLQMKNAFWVVFTA